MENFITKSRILFFVSILFVLLITSCSNNNSNDILEDPQLECVRVGGEWKDFPTPCSTEECSIVRSGGSDICIQVITPSCDCAPDSCWNGKTCEKTNPNTELGNNRLQICPEMWYDNQEPPSSGENQYFVLNGERRELSEFDVDWVKNNCNLTVQVVQ